MMKRPTLTAFGRYGKTTRRAQFLADMQALCPWAQLTAVVEPFYPKISDEGGRLSWPHSFRQRDRWKLRSLQARISLEKKESHDEGIPPQSLCGM